MTGGCISQIVDSPIEKHFLDGWISNNCGAYVSRIEGEGFKSRLHIDTPLSAFNIYTQYRIGIHRVDFLCVCDTRRVIVECDGHEFHERTPQQAAKDRQRERALVAAGYAVLRFTGSELYRSGAACAAEVQKYLEART